MEVVEDIYSYPILENTFRTTSKKISNDGSSYTLVKESSKEFFPFTTLEKFLPVEALGAVTNEQCFVYRNIIDERNLRMKYQNDTSIIPFTNEELDVIKQSEYNPVTSKSSFSTDSVREKLKGEKCNHSLKRRK